MEVIVLREAKTDERKASFLSERNKLRAIQLRPNGSRLEEEPGQHEAKDQCALESHAPKIRLRRKVVKVKICASIPLRDA
jgi:hypothetical protein